MTFTVIFTNITSNKDSIITLNNTEALDQFVDDVEYEIYTSNNKHIRNETPNNKNIIKQFVIFTSSKDVERVTIKRN